MAEITVAIYGAGQVGSAVAEILRERGDYSVVGPQGRDRREAALRSGADVVVIATTSFLRDLAPDIRDAVEAGSNVFTSAEECAYPWAVDAMLADELDQLARSQGVTIVGGGLNPGFAFDALVVTALGATRDATRIRVERVVDLSRFSSTILHRLGLGFDPDEFASRREAHTVHGHIGFPQSMHVVAGVLGVELDRIEAKIEPIFSLKEERAPHLTIAPGQSAGFDQYYTGFVGGERWFECAFTGHVNLGAIARAPRDEIWIDGTTPLHLTIDPGLNPQVASSAVIANSVRRVAEAPSGWQTVGVLPPARPG